MSVCKNFIEMSVSIGRKFLTHIRQSNLKTCEISTAIVRFKTTVAKEKSPSVEKKDAIPEPEPGKIHAVVLKEFESPLLIENVEKPKIIENNEVLINVHYCAINLSDILLSKNAYKCKPDLPMILGYEIVGQLVEIGQTAEKKGYKVGDKVVALNKERYGGLAEQCIAEVQDVWRIPSSLKSVDAVCLLDSYVTALVALEKKVSLSEDDMILINVGISGAGLAAVDLATNVYRAKVICVCATEDGAALARDKGAYAALKFKDRKLLKQLEEIAADRDIKAIFEGDEGTHLKKILNCFTDIYKEDHAKDILRDDNFAVVVEHLSREGRIIIAGSAVTKSHENPDEEKDSFSLTGFDLWQYRQKKPEDYREAGEEVLQLYEEGLINPTRSHLAGLHKVNNALEYAYKGKSPGKVVIDIRHKEVDEKEGCDKD